MASGPHPATLRRAARAAWPLVFAAGCAGRGADAPAPLVCPDMTVDALDLYDLAAGMGVHPPLSGKLKAGVASALTLSTLALDLEDRLGKVCGAYLRDLGAKPKSPKAADACAQLVQALVEARARLGPGVTVLVDTLPPVCGASLDSVSQCAAQCDPAVATSGAKATCEPGTLSGGCDGICAGECSGLKGTACLGACDGTCDGKVKGTCTGLCTGKCDGKVTAKGGVGCAGVCEGTCDGPAMAVCSGACSGLCVQSGPSKCGGVCTGSCTTDAKLAVCTGDIHSARLNRECQARCDARALATLTCAPTPAYVRVLGASDPAAAVAFKSAAEKNLPALETLVSGFAPRVASVATEVVEGAAATRTTVAASLPDPKAARQVTGCFDRPLSDATVAAAALRGDLDLALSVRAALTNGGPGVGAVVILPRK